MIRKIRLAVFVAFLYSCRVHAQISPGPLYSGHERLEGIEKCTLCHTVGKLLSNEKCVACHKAIAARINQRTGYHATVAAKSCTLCHLDHLGRDYQIVRFDTSSFDHALAGFQLLGKHKTAGCRQCHNSEKIFSQDTKAFSLIRKGTTYLGLSPVCESCHEDIHRGQFTQVCSSCHGNDHWKPADNFHHERTNYPLTGKHKEVGCYSCHDQKLSDDKTVRFTNIKFSSCGDCHNDPHKGRFPQPCSACHTTETFVAVSQGEFDHSKTSFPLLGKHSDVKCVQCHQKGPKKKNISGEVGFHITRFQLCSDCHEDSHAGQFADRRDKGKCEACHSVSGWIPASYSIADHQKSRFILDGAHLAVACSDCHLSNKVNAKSTRQFRWIGALECTTCHRDVHSGQFNSEMTDGCSTCHITGSWHNLPAFSHDRTKFPLRGKHSQLKCEQCHIQSKDPAQPVLYVGLKTACSSCHSDEHQGQFQIEGTTDCARCHTADSWHKVIFDHDTQSDFPLTGKHTEVPCAKCHPTVVMNSKQTVKYKPIETTCTDCHTTKG